MKKQELKDQTTEQLTKTMNMLKGITGALIVMIIILLSISIYGLIMKENNTIFIALIAVGTPKSIGSKSYHQHEIAKNQLV